jgi:Ankyrin repeats (many copies)
LLINFIFVLFRHGDSVLHQAVKSGSVETLKYLINHFRIDVPARNAPNSPYQFAINFKKNNVAELFPLSMVGYLLLFFSFLFFFFFFFFFLFFCFFFCFFFIFFLFFLKNITYCVLQVQKLELEILPAI